jgi:hypothetical protein
MTDLFVLLDNGVGSAVLVQVEMLSTHHDCLDATVVLVLVGEPWVQRKLKRRAFVARGYQVLPWA